LRASVAAQVLAIVSLLVALLLGSYGVIEARRARELGAEALREGATWLAAVHADGLAAAMWDFNDAQIRALLEAFTLDPDFVAAVVVEAGGGTTAERRVASAAGPGAVTIVREIGYGLGGRRRVLGELRLTLGAERLERELARGQHRRIGVLLGLGCSVLAVILLAFRRVSVPLRATATVVAGLARGRRDLIVPGLDRRDEIGGIARALEAFRRQSLEMDRLRELQERASLEDRLRIRAALDSSADAVVITGIDGSTLYVNPAARTLLGAGSGQAPSVRRMVRRLRPARQAAALARAMRAHGGAWRGEVSFAAGGSGAEELRLWLRLDGIRGSDGIKVGHVMLGTDVTERHAAETRIQFLAHHDPLTGLPNRALLRERVEAALAEAARDRRQGALLLLDLDRFKEVNDTLGYPMGDALLREVALRLRAAVREGDVVARLGGDEFAVLLPGPTDASAATELAGRLVAEMARPFEIEGHRLFVGTSVGVALVPDHGAAPDLLMRHADLALYRAKGQGRGTHALFDAALGAGAERRRGLADAIRRGLTASEFSIHYQPQLDLATGALTGCEALARWSLPGRGAVPPDEFIPVAEEHGLIGELGDWVLRAACTQLRAWLDRGHDPGRLAVNLSPAQFRDDLARRIAAVLAETGVEPARIELEITETALLRDSAVNFRLLGELRALGLRTALDDFGTGFSSLNHLRRFPFDRIKIDRGFVAELETSADTAALVGGLIDLGHRLGLRVTAEGIETAGQLARLQALGCDEGQGALFGMPGPPDALAACLQAGAAAFGSGALVPSTPRPSRCRHRRRAAGPANDGLGHGLEQSAG
jgi:diguanylate cyclase (GGDEF)-like protein